MTNNQRQEPSVAAPIRREVVKSPITVDVIRANEFQKEGTMTAQLRQLVKTTAFYPSKQIANEMQDNLFDAVKDFGFTEQAFVSEENRVGFMVVPVNASVEDVLKRLKEAPEACLYRVISNQPILTSDQNYAISQGLKTLEDFALTQIVRYPEGTVKEGHDVSGQIVLDRNGKVQYRRIYFSINKKDDVDLRTTNPADVYMTDAIKVELAGASAAMPSQVV
jgi:hypothetical protein